MWLAQSGMVVPELNQTMICKRPHGFTLLEVLIALVVVALAMVALVRASGMASDALMREREVTLATWVASNVITDTRNQAGFPAVGQRSGRMLMGEQEWSWSLAIQGTDDPAMRRLEVRVFADSAREQGVTSLVGFMGARQ
jgi:general secretion pathway protein I